MKTYYFIATFLICNILFGCSYHCKKELESFRQKNRDWAVVGVWEAIPEEDEELSEMKLAVEIYNSDGSFHIAQSSVHVRSLVYGKQHHLQKQM